MPFYIGGQLLGAILATLTLRLLIGDVALLGATVPSGSVGQSFGIEILLSAVLMFVIIALATDTRAVGETSAIAIGAAIGGFVYQVIRHNPVKASVKS